MADLTSKQLILPFELEEVPHYTEIVRQNWQFTFSRQMMTSVYSKRVIGYCVAQMKTEGDMRDYYQIRAIDIIQDTNLSRAEVYRCFKSVIYELSNIVFFFENEEKQRIIPRHLLDTGRYDHPAGYYNGVLTIAFNPTLKQLIMQLAHYSDYDLKLCMNFSHWYSMRLWEILQAFEDKEFVEFDIDHYREWMGCGIELNPKNGVPKFDKNNKIKYIKYNSHSNMIDKTTEAPLREFKGTKLEFTVQSITDKAYAGKGRPKITKIRFNFVRKPMTTEDEINALISENTAFKRIIERLRTYKVHDEVIAAYASIIGAETLNKTLYSWDIKQQSTDPKLRISNTENYCNKVISEMGRKLASFMKLQENMRRDIEKEEMNKLNIK